MRAMACGVILLSTALGCAGKQAAAPAAAVEATPQGRPAAEPAFTLVTESPRAGAPKSPGLTALEQELQRAMKELKEQDPAPYFIAYEVHDRSGVSIDARNGALMSSSHNHTRVLDVDVRVGSHKFDSTRPSPGRGFDASSPPAVSLPLEDDAAALRSVAWKSTEQRYKAAAERFVQLKTRQNVDVGRDDKSDDFSREKPVVLLEPVPEVKVDVAAWEARVRALSARFRQAPDVLSSSVAFGAGVHTRWLVNSEGSLVQTSRPAARVSISGAIRADDGQDLHRHESFDAVSADGLPSEAVMAAAADRLIADLRALRAAPPAEPFSGPAILQGRAAAVFFHEIFGHRVEGHRQKDEGEGQTFAKKINEPIMPSFISVFDDPRLAKLDGRDLNGFYLVDDEAVHATRASLVENGIMKGFLLGRTPTRGFVRSNGHGRRQEGRRIVPRQANLVVKPSVAVSTAELRQRLIAEAKRQGKAYGLMFDHIDGGFTSTGRSGLQAFKVLPVMVYRVYADGRPDQLIRGADLVGTPLSALSKIVAASDDFQVFNGYCGAESGLVPVSGISPSLLIEQLEVERKAKGQDKPPVLPPPPLPAATAAAAAGDDVVRRAMADEMARAMKELEIPNEPRPHRIMYVLTDSEQAGAGATFGARTAAVPRRWRNLRVEVRVGDRTYDSGNYADNTTFFTEFAQGVPIEDDYLALRRELWLRTDEVFKRAVDAIGKKRAAEKAQAKGEDEAPFDYAEAKPAELVAASEAAREKIDPEALAKVITELSGLFREYPAVHGSRASGEHIIVRQRLLTSDGSWKDDRRSMVEAAVHAETQADDGMSLRSFTSFQAANLQGLPPGAEMARAVKAFAADLTAARKAPVGDEGTAVVLFEGRAAGQLLRRLLADQLSGTPPPRAPASGRVPFPRSDLAGKLGQRIAPAFLEVHDDPREAVGPGKVALVGAYQVDDEGVAAERVSVIEKGVLKALLMSRTPRKEIVRSNGHGRGRVMAGAVRGKAGVLFVSAGKAGLGEPSLRARAIKEAQATGKDVPVYVVRHLDSTAAAGAGIRPMRIVRLRDGKEEPVRGVSFNSLLPRSLKDIVALGKEPAVYNYLMGSDGHISAGGSPGSIVAPSVVFKDVEVKKDTDKNPRPPLYPHPHFAEK